MALRLFEHPLSPYARKVKIVLYEKGIPFDRIFVDPNVQSDDPVYQEFVLSSPRREVPCLVDGDVRLCDSTVVLEYLEERWPKPESMPSGAAERGRVRMLEEWMDTDYEAVNWGLMEILYFKRARGERAEAILERIRTQLERIWNRLERELEGRDWMNGERFGRGDAAVLPHVAASAMFGRVVPETCPRLGAWRQRCASRASVAKEAAEVEEFLRREVAAGLEGDARSLVRQYRDHRLEWMMRSGGVDVVLEGLENGTIRFSHEPE